MTELSDEAIRREALVRLQQSQDRRNAPRLRRRLTWLELVGAVVIVLAAVVAVWVLMILLGVADSAYSS